MKRTASPEITSNVKALVRLAVQARNQSRYSISESSSDFCDGIKKGYLNAAKLIWLNGSRPQFRN